MIDASQNADDARQGNWTVPFVAALLAMFTMQMSSLGFAPLLPAIQGEFRASYSQIGLFTGLYGIIAVLVSYPAGLLIKRFGERRVLGNGLLLVSFGLCCLSLASSFPLGLAGRVVWLVGYRMSFVAVFTAIAVTCPASLRGVVMGVLGAVSSFASVVGAPFGSVIARHMNWHKGIFAFAVMALLGSLQFWLLYRSPASTTNARSSAAASQTTETPRRPVYRIPAVWALTLLLGCCNAGGFSATFFVPLALKTTYGLDVLHISYVVSGAYTFAIFANLAVGRMMDRFSRWNVLSWVAAVSMAASIALNSPQVAVFCVAVVLLIGLGLVASTQVFGIAGSIVPGKDTGPVMGLVGLGSGVFGYVVPQLLGLLRDRTGAFHAGWFLLTGACAITLVEVILLRRVAARSAVA